MSLFRTKNTLGTNRPSVLLQMRLRDHEDDPLDASDVWNAVQALFKDHPNLEVYQVEIRPDKDAKTSISEE